jgi:hypothetical protein
MIVHKSKYTHTHVVRGGGIFDTTANIVKKITRNNFGKLASKLWYRRVRVWRQKLIRDWQ